MILIIFLIFIQTVKADLEIMYVSGVSKYIPGENKIFAGTAGEECRGNTSTCDSCTGWGDKLAPEACNAKRINDQGGSLSFEFRGPTYGTPVITDNDKTTNLAIGPDSENGTYYIAIPWDVLCEHIISNNNCDSRDGDGTIYVGIDKNEDGILGSEEESIAMNIVILSGMEGAVDMIRQENGIGEFKVYPGDKKVYLLDGMLPYGNFPYYNGTTTFEEIRLYYEETNRGCGDVTQISNTSRYVSTKILDLTSEEEFQVEHQYFKNFENKKTFLFKLALVDEAGNIGLFTPDAACNSDHIATPDNVYGMLGSNKCFIVETAMGSSMYPHVSTLRQFRDKKLMANTLGRSIVDAYYSYSPYMTKFIKKNKALKIFSRILLLPLITFAYLGIYLGFIGTFVIYALLLVSCMALRPVQHQGYNRVCS